MLTFLMKRLWKEWTQDLTAMMSIVIAKTVIIIKSIVIVKTVIIRKKAVIVKIV